MINSPFSGLQREFFDSAYIAACFLTPADATTP